MVDPFANATNNPSIPPMCTRGTDMIDTEGMGSTSGANAAIRGATTPWVSGTAFGVPVVPLVNSTTASSPAAGSVGLTGGRPWAVEELSRTEERG